MASIFPNSPELNSVFTSNGTTWQWNGEAWTVVASDGQTFTNIVTSPSSQTISADSPTDTLTITAGTNISVSANSSNDSITINSTGNYSSVDSITYPDYIVFDTTPENTSASTSTLAWDSGEGGLGLQLNANTQVTLGQEIIVLCNNGEATTLNKGEVVRFSGASGQKPQVTRAYNTSDAGSALTFGIVAESIASGAEGFVVTQGIVKNINTNAYNEGDILYLSASAGVLTTVKPQAPNHYVFVGVVIKKNSSSGRIYVKPQNGYELDEIHDVRITDIQNNDIILWNSASSIWVNSVLPVSLPNQTGNDGKYLTTNGASASWATLDLNSAINTASAAAVNYLVDSAPGTLDTLNELSAALNDDPNFYSTIQAVYLTQSNASATYATISDANTSISRWSKIYSASATVISGVDDNANNLDYTFGYTTLFINGILQDPSNYTASSGSTIVLNDAVLINDVVEVLSYRTFNVANTYTASEIDSKVSNYTRWVKTLSGSATVISGVDDNSLSLLYTIGNEEVYVNGILLKEDTDYATTSASSITLSVVALSGDTVEIINFSTINLASVYTKTESDNLYATQNDLNNIDLTEYLTEVSASSTYLAQTSASTTYLTQSNGITAATASATYIPQSSPVTSFKNKIINSEFDIWQRGTTFSAGGYTADRWLLQVDGSSATRAVSQQALTPGSITGYESPFFLRYNQSVAGSSATFNILDQRIEDVRTLAGQVVTVSFWAKADSSRTITSSIQQVFGTGGSSEVAGLATSNINITTSWARYSYTGTLASISGKTVGTNSYAAFRINFPLNTTFTVDIWGVQVERGSIATEFEQRFIGDELRMCQRYAWTIRDATNINSGSFDFLAGGTADNSGTARFSVQHPMQMRVPPSLVIPSGAIASNYAILNASGVTACSAVPNIERNSDTHTLLNASRTGMSTGQQVFLRSNGSVASFSNFILLFSAEL